MGFLLTCLRFFSVSSLSSHVILEILCSEVWRPRGVSLPRALLYSPLYDFTCLDNTKTIPFSHVNDDYCDCLDASDEPGTSACPYGTFYCTNAGYESMIIGSIRVNDGICDCCDGSDEYTSSSICVNNCIELDKFAKERAIEQEKILKLGRELRAELSEKGFQERERNKKKLIELEMDKIEAERSMTEKQRLKIDAEELEKNALQYYNKLEQKNIDAENKTQAEAFSAFSRYDLNQDGKVSFIELQQDHTFDKNNDGEVSPEEAKYFLNGHEDVGIETFFGEAWSRIHQIIIEDPMYKINPAKFDEVSTEEGEVDNERDVRDDYENVPDQHDLEQEEGEIVTLRYDEETQKVIDSATAARNEFSVAESGFKAIESEIKNIKRYLENDFGPDEEYAPLRGQCFEYIDHEYIYKLCPFDKTLQQPKSGSVETCLGSWGKWSGPEHDKHQSMLYEEGQACWNGPQRSTLVKLSCGSVNEITSVAEPNKCEYVFTFVTPAACYDGINDTNEKEHDEL